MNKSLNFILAVTTVIIYISSCGNKSGNHKVFKSDKDTLQYSIANFDTVYKANDSVSGDSSYVAARYIVFKNNNPELDNWLNNHIQNELCKSGWMDTLPAKSLSQLAYYFFEDYEQYKKDMPEGALPYMLDKDVSICGRYGHIISLNFNEYIYTGGAHGSDYTQFINYDLANKKICNNAQLFNLTNDSLLQIAEKYFRLQNEIPTGSSLSDAGYFWGDDVHKEGQFYLNTNFYFEKDTITWVYNSYEIASYAAGHPSLSIPLAEIKQFMTNSKN
jgi:hypothetical protein